MKIRATYLPEIELAKGAKFEAATYDKTQTIKVVAAKITVGGTPGIAEISGIATGRNDASINGTIGIWLSIFRFMRPDGTINHVAGWNIMLPLKTKQTAMLTAKSLAKVINDGPRPYKAKAMGGRNKASIAIIYRER